MTEEFRKLVTIRRVDEINPIPGADSIEVLSVDGWKVVSQKGNFQPGDACVYFEIDSFLPEADERFQFLMKGGVRTFDGVRGHKLSTVKLRGQVSQGLCLPPSLFPELIDFILQAPDGTDFAQRLGVVKWEPQIPAELAGQVDGPFPSFIKKTDQERCQNIVNEIFVENKDSAYEITTKLDGTSVTFYFNDGKIGACGRNWEFKINEENANNTIIKLLNESGLATALEKLGRNIAIQGELMGPGIQGNRENLKHHVFFIFDVQDIDSQKFIGGFERADLLNKLIGSGVNKDLVNFVPMVANNVTLEFINVDTVEALLEYAEGPSINHPIREGLVFKRLDGGFSFKAISNKFLLKEGD